jgi:hypothetical protein
VVTTIRVKKRRRQADVLERCFDNIDAYGLAREEKSQQRKKGVFLDGITYGEIDFEGASLYVPVRMLIYKSNSFLVPSLSKPFRIQGRAEACKPSAGGMLCRYR